jgi:hypothetical protein
MVAVLRLQDGIKAFIVSDYSDFVAQLNYFIWIMKERLLL